MDKKIEFTLFFAKKFAHLEKKLLLLHANFKLIHDELIHSPLFPHSGGERGIRTPPCFAIPPNTLFVPKASWAKHRCGIIHKGKQ